MARPLKYGHVRIICDDPAVQFQVLLSEEQVRYTGGFGGWEVTNRPRQVGMTTWNGQEPLQLTLGLLFNTWTTTGTIDDKMAKLRKIARGDDESPPGVLRLEGIPDGDREWVIEGLEFGDAIRNPDGYAVRQEATLTLREFVPPSYLQLRRKALTGAKRKTKVINAKQGDTAASIAKRQRCKWTQIRDLNKRLKWDGKVHTLRANRPVIKAGTKVRVPVAQAKHKKRGHAGGGRGTRKK